MMSSYIYIRTSTEDQTPEIQLKDIQSLNPPLDSVIIKEQISAWKENVKRPVFENLLSLIKAGKVDHLYCWDLDRLYRNRHKLKELLILCKIHKVTLLTCNQGWLDDLAKIPPPFNEIFMDMLIGIFGWLAEDESSKKSKRVKMAVVRSEKGTFSYKKNKWGRKPFPKQTVNRVIELYYEGKSVRAIAKEVMVYDKNNNGRNISKSAVHKIITGIAA